MSVNIAALLGKTSTPVITPAPAPAPAASSAPAPATNGVAEHKKLDLIITPVRAGRAMADNGINAEQTNQIKAILDKINTLPGHKTDAEGKAFLAKYQKENKKAHEQKEEILKQLQAEAKKDEDTEEYKNLIAQKKKVSSEKKNISSNARVGGAALAQTVVMAVNEIGFANFNGKRFTPADLFDNGDIYKMSYYPLFRDGKYCKPFIQKYEKEARDRQLKHILAQAATTSVTVKAPQLDKETHTQETAEDNHVTDEEGNIEPKDFMCYIDAIHKNMLEKFNTQQALNNVVPNDKIQTESEYKKFLSYVAFDVLDCLGRAIVASFEYSKTKTLTGDNVLELLAVILHAASVPQSEITTVMSKINVFLKQNDEIKVDKKNEKESKLSEDEKAKLAKEKAEKDAMNAKKKEIRDRMKTLEKEALAKLESAK